MKNVLLMTISILFSLFLTSCVKNPNAYQPPQPPPPPVEVDPDVSVHIGTLNIQYDSSGRTWDALGQFAVVNVNTQIQTQQFIYSAKISLRNFEGLIDSVMVQVGTNPYIYSKFPAGQDFEVILNQNLNSNYKSSPIFVFVKRAKPVEGSQQKIVSIAMENIQARIKGIDRNIVPLSKDKNAISFALK